MPRVLDAHPRNDDPNLPSETEPRETRVRFLLDESFQFKGYLLHKILIP